MSIIYRQIKESDGEDIKKLINESFGLSGYISNKSVLDSWLNVYLQSCLAEQTFACIAQEDDRVIGVIMGKANSDYKAAAHAKHIFLMGWHTLNMQAKAAFHKISTKSNTEMHEIYSQLSKACPQTFDGVLTLFAVSEQSRGKGVGKGLLMRLLDYQRKNKVKNIYLYTDSACNYGFYESQGFKKLGEKYLTVEREGVPTRLDVYLYGYNIEEELSGS